MPHSAYLLVLILIFTSVIFFVYCNFQKCNSKKIVKLNVSTYGKHLIINSYPVNINVVIASFKNTMLFNSYL